MNPYRYPGPQPFTEQHKNVFFGREKEIDELSKLVRREPWILLYGKSGLGKSSLLNAGLAPRLSLDSMIPIFVRFQAWTPNRNETPLDITKNIISSNLNIQNTLNDHISDDIIPTLEKLVPADQSLWRVLKEHQSNRENINRASTILLIFDQFEELFTFPKSEVDLFAKNIAEVFYSDLPDRYHLALETYAELIPKETMLQLHEPLRLRIISALRTDRMAQMHQIKPFLPDILDVACELGPLSRSAAEGAVLNPAYDTGEFRTPRFDYDDNAIDRLLNFLSGAQSEIEPFQLQILCEHFEKIVIERDQQTRITLKDLVDPEGILKNYYKDKIDEIVNPGDRTATRKLIEEGLVQEGDPPIRLSLHQAQIQQFYGIPKHLLEILVNQRLLRAEPGAGAGYTYELPHDTLLEPVLKMKHERLNKEKQDAHEREIIAEKTESERRKKRSLITLSFAIGLILIAVIATFQAINKQFQVESLAENVVSVNLSQAREDILHLQYENAFEKLKKASKLGAMKDSVAFELMEIAFFYNNSGEASKGYEPLALSASLLGKPVSTTQKENLSEVLHNLDYQRDSFLNLRYFPKMIPINGGNFLVQKKYSTNMPDLLVATTEITVWQYNLFCAESGRDIAQRTSSNGVDIYEDKYQPSWGWIGDNPVVYVNWYDAIEYANWLSRKVNLIPAYDVKLEEDDPSNISTIDFFKWNITQRPEADGYCLPTEAEWEYIARGATQLDSTIYAGSDDAKEVAWYAGNSDNRTHSVGTKKPNGEDLYDISGNVWEWCWDWFKELNDQNSAVKNQGSTRVVRGGAWCFHTMHCSVQYRGNVPPYERNNDTGFRLVAHSTSKTK
jgi:formylglycine-generating enzyme required for sulfatase activity